MERQQRNRKQRQKQGGLLMLVLVVLLTVSLITSACVVVKSGSVGVVYHMGAVQDEVMYPGLNFKIPFITSHKIVNTQTTKVEVESSAASKDLQTVISGVAVNYHIAPETAPLLVRDVGSSYEQTIIVPAIQESVKAAMSQYSAEQLITRRPEVSSNIKEGLADKVATYGIVVDEFNIINLDFSEEFNAAIEAKQTAEQNALKAEQELVRITIEAQQQVEQAKAEAEAIREKAEAEAYAIEVIQQELAKSSNYIEYQMIEKWNGELPIVQGDSGAILDIRNFKQ